MADPTWLTAKADQRVALIEESVDARLKALGMIMTPLSEPREYATAAEFQRWDRTCDNCGTYCPGSKAFYTGHLVRHLKGGTPVYITFGVCEKCTW